MANEPSIVTMNISFPQPLKQFVDGKVRSGIYSSVSEFVRDAIRKKLRRDQEQLEARNVLSSKLLQGLGSGKPIPFADGYFQRKKATLPRRVSRKKIA